MENGKGQGVNIGANSGGGKVTPATEKGVLNNPAHPKGQSGPVPGVPCTQKK